MFECKQLNVSVGERALLKNINLRFEPDCITAILGANGAGKSTLFKALLGELSSAKAAVLFDGKCIQQQSLNELAAARAFVPQQHRLAFSLPVFEYLLLAREHIRESNDASCSALQQAALDFQLLHLLDKDMTQLSGGEAQLIEFARAYLQVWVPGSLKGKCLLLDEPASALDIKQTKRLYQFLLKFKEDGGTVILIDHDINAMASVADNLVLLKQGQVLASGKSDSVFSAPLLNQCFGVQGCLYQPTNAPDTQTEAQSTSEQANARHSVFHLNICI